MTKEQALHTFWSQFGVKAYDQNTVPDDEALPYITYEVGVDNFGNTNALTASIWDKSKSWASVTTILRRIENSLAYGGQTVGYDNGMAWIKRGVPFAQRMSDPDDSIRRIVLNIEVDFNSEV
jgi:hypothetical protein